MSSTAPAIVWLRQDLRLADNPALAYATANHQQVLVVYIFDETEEPALGGAQGWWLHHSLSRLGADLKQQGLQLCLRRGESRTQLLALIAETGAAAVYWNRCYEPNRIARDKALKLSLQQAALTVQSFNGFLLLEPWTVANQQGAFFKVFTPFWKQCLRQISVGEPCALQPGRQSPDCPSDQLDDWQLLPKQPDWAAAFSEFWQPGEAGAMQSLTRFLDDNLSDYGVMRDIPAQTGTSRLSPHLHFGEISPQQVWRATQQAMLDPRCNLQSAQRFLAELGWREFSWHLLYHFPALDRDNFRPEFNAFVWDQDEKRLRLWQRGQTGYPIVDAGMRELWQTGYMHNRVRMIAASFLTKDLLLDWRLGAQWFWYTLLDADLANNSASWQWVAGCGADAAPYFRIFNPVLQGEKFDPKGDYVKRFVPELAKVPQRWIHQPWAAPARELGIKLGQDYPHPMVDHQEQRQLALARFAALP